MKKYLRGSLVLGHGPRIDWKMKLSTFFLIVSFFQIQAKSYSQNAKLTLDLENSRIEQIFDEIETISEFRFLFDSDQIDLDRKVSLHVKKKKISHILRLLFKGTDIDYRTYNRQIILTKKNVQKIISPSVSIIEEAEVVQQTISGTITDETGTPLPGASIVEKGSTNGTQTDFDGNFVLEVKDENAILVVSYIGFATQEVPLNAQTTFTIALKEDVAGLDEVVVVGYGTMKKVNLTGSIATVSAEKLENRPVVNIAQALQGQMPGVRIQQSNGGQPGNEGINIQVRGRNSFARNPNDPDNLIPTTPLVIIDGIVGSLNDVDVNAIESATVLKDAASAAIYGARASNGVILITTKTGGQGQKLSVKYSGRTLVQTPYMWKERIWDSPEYMRLHNLSLDNSQNTWPRYTDEQISAYESGPSAENPWFNYEDKYIKNITASTHNLSFSGSSGKTNYFVSGNLWSQDGIIPGFNLERYNGLANLQSQLNKRVKFGMSVGIKNETVKQPYVSTGDFISSLLSNRPTYTPFTQYDSNRFTWVRYNGTEWANKNPEAMINAGGQRTKEKSLRSNAYFDVKLIDGLTWSIKGAMNFGQRDYRYLEPAVKVYLWDDPDAPGADMNGQVLNKIRNRVTLWENSTLYSSLNYVKSVGEHNFNVLAGVSQESFFTKYVQAFRENLPNLDLDVVNAGSTENWSNEGGITSERTLRSGFGRFKYDFKGKYLLELNARVDGSSRFPEANKYAFFPSVSAAWRISEESFLEDKAEWIDNLKIRASIGTLGNDFIGDYPYQATLALGNNYPFNATVISGAARSALANEKIKWETTKTYGVGLDATFWRGLLDITFDVFDKRTEGILRGSQLPGYVGFDSPVVNEGIVSNKGLEFVIGHRNTIDEFSYGINFIFSTYKNRLVEFGADQINGINRMKNGEEINRYFTYVADGLFQSQAEIDAAPEQLSARETLIPGDIRLKDVSGPDGVPDGIITPDDRVGIDGVNPDFEYGSSLFFSWKGFDLSALFQGVQGVKTNVNSVLVRPWGQGAAPLKYWRDAWSETNTNTDVPVLRSAWGGSQWSQTMNVTSSWWLKDASYFRLKNLSLGYNIPSRSIEKLGMESLKITASAENVFTITSFEFGDPERASGFSYPSVQTFSIGLDIKF